MSRIFVKNEKYSTNEEYIMKVISDVFDIIRIMVNFKIFKTEWKLNYSLFISVQ